MLRIQECFFEQNMKPIKIFKVGTHTDMNGLSKRYTRSMLAACAAAYSPDTHEAPLVLGHPKHDDPAMGWVDYLELDKDGYLLAYPKNIDPVFAESVNAGKNNKISASFYLPDSPNNPMPGTLYLRHVGFLGAQVPAVKGLGTVQFGEQDENGVVNFMSPAYAFELVADVLRRQRDALIASNGVEEAEKQIPIWVIDSLKKDVRLNDDKLQPAFAEPTPPKDQEVPKTPREIELEQQLEQAQATLKAQAIAEQESVASNFAESLVVAGQIPPKLKEDAIALLTAAMQNQKTTVVAFSEGEVSFSEGLQTFLKQLPKVIEFGEHNPKGLVDPNINQPENPLIADSKNRK